MIVGFGFVAFTDIARDWQTFPFNDLVKSNLLLFFNAIKWAFVLNIVLRTYANQAFWNMSLVGGLDR